MQEALEREVEEFLGRRRYRRGERVRGGQRNGYEPKRVVTATGPLPLALPQLRGSGEPFTTRLLPKGVVQTQEPKALILAGFVPGRRSWAACRGRPRAFPCSGQCWRRPRRVGVACP